MHDLLSLIVLVGVVLCFFMLGLFFYVYVGFLLVGCETSCVVSIDTTTHPRNLHYKSLGQGLNLSGS